MSTIHIDPTSGRGERDEVIVIGDVPRLPPQLVRPLPCYSFSISPGYDLFVQRKLSADILPQEEIPCKRTFGATASSTALDEPIIPRPKLGGSSSSLPRVTGSDQPSFVRPCASPSVT